MTAKKGRNTRLENVAGDFARLWNEGVPRREIEARFRVCRRTVDNWARKLGLPRRKAGRPRKNRAASAAGVKGE